MAIAQRQRHVASMRLRGMGSSEIQQGLIQLGCLNTSVDPPRPWSTSTIKEDMRRLRKRWQKEATQTVAQLQARNLAELREVRRAAWGDNRYDVVLQSLRDEAKLLGVDARSAVEAMDAANRHRVLEMMEKVIDKVLEHVDDPQAIEAIMDEVRLLRPPEDHEPAAGSAGGNVIDAEFETDG